MFKTSDGTRYIVRDEAELVTKLREASRTPSPSDGHFMNDAAYRASVQTGFIVRDDSPSNFVEDLKAAGLLTEPPTPH